jgi:hypothetical protein
MNLYQLYMNNGYIVDQITKTNANYFVGALAIRYDQWVYIGNMNSFSFGYEEGTMHGGISFDVEFNVVAMYDLAQPVTAVSPLLAPTKSPSDRRNRPKVTTSSEEGQDIIQNSRGFDVARAIEGNAAFSNRGGTPQQGKSASLSRGSGGFRATDVAAAVNGTGTGVEKRPTPFVGLGRSEL